MKREEMGLKWWKEVEKGRERKVGRDVCEADGER